MRRLFALFLFINLTSCGTMSEIDIIDDITAPDYVSSSKARKLEIPPDLSEIETQDNYEVPGEARSYKNYKDKQKNTKPSKSIKVVQEPDGIKIIKSGNLRWLIVNKDPDTLWPHIQDFWEEEMGFRVKVANKRTGVIETEWISTSDLSTKSSSALDKWLDSMSGFADKRKFRTRLELGSKNGTTEIFLSHRSSFAGANQHNEILSNRGDTWNISEIYAIEEYVSEDGDGQSKTTKSEQMKVEDYEINSEILRRLMIKLGATDFDAKEKIERPQEIVKAELINTEQGKFIQMNDPYDRAWRRLSLALDMIGFITEDKDRSKGIFYVKYKDIELPSMEQSNQDKSLFDSFLFWRDEDETDLSKDKKSSSVRDQVDEEKTNNGTDDSNVEESTDTDEKLFSEKSWDEKFPIRKFWGSDEEKKPDDEFRYRVRISPMDEFTKVYLDLPNGSLNNSEESQQIIKIIFEQLK
jgi:outer membrane protein assembly factor BamC